MSKSRYELYTINKNVRCVNCGNRGAIQSYGEWCPSGQGDEVNGYNSLEEYRDKEFMNHTMGFGGTIPHQCMNCDNHGLIDFGGLEGYHMAFETINREPHIKRIK